MNTDQTELELGIEFPTAQGNLSGTVAEVLSEFEDEEFTCYRVHVVVNLVFQTIGSEYRVRPQMMYNYDHNGMIVKGSKGKGRFNRSEVAEFVLRFVERNKNR